MKNIHILPTDKPSRLHLWLGAKLETCELEYSHTRNTQHMHITSDEEFKEGWRGYVFKENATDKVFIYTHSKDNTIEWYKDVKKIILTTDADLIKYDVQAIDDEFLEWFIKNPNCEEVEFEKEHDDTVLYPKMRYVKPYKIIIPKETLEEAYLNKLIDEANKEFTLDRKLAKEVAIKFSKWQQEQYKNNSKEEVKDLLQNIINEIEIKKQNIISNSEKMTTHLLEGGCMAFESSQDIIKEWINKFKKK